MTEYHHRNGASASAGIRNATDELDYLVERLLNWQTKNAMLFNPYPFGYFTVHGKIIGRATSMISEAVKSMYCIANGSMPPSGSRLDEKYIKKQARAIINGCTD